MCWLAGWRRLLVCSCLAALCLPGVEPVGAGCGGGGGSCAAARQWREAMRSWASRFRYPACSVSALLSTWRRVAGLLLVVSVAALAAMGPCASRSIEGGRLAWPHPSMPCARCRRTPPCSCPPLLTHPGRPAGPRPSPLSRLPLAVAGQRAQQQPPVCPPSRCSWPAGSTSSAS